MRSYARANWNRSNSSGLDRAAGTGRLFGDYRLLEMAKLWGLVFPRFIGDPTIGIHFGRARGPMLQSVRLGVACSPVWPRWWSTRFGYSP